MRRWSLVSNLLAVSVIEFYPQARGGGDLGRRRARVHPLRLRTDKSPACFQWKPSLVKDFCSRGSIFSHAGFLATAGSFAFDGGSPQDVGLSLGKNVLRVSVTAAVLLILEGSVVLILGLLYVFRTDRVARVLQRWNRDRLPANQSWLGWKPGTLRRVGWLLISMGTVTFAIVLAKVAS